MQQFILLVMLATTVTSQAATLQSAVEAPSEQKHGKTNIIYLIGDGMGVAATSAYRYYNNSSTNEVVDSTIFDEMLVGMASTYPDDGNANVTDSAAAGTALAGGIKTYNGAIGVNKQHKNVNSLLDAARHQGYQTGIAVTSQINHATPAAFVGHADSRFSYDKLADQYLDLRINYKPKVDVMLGGGQEYFIRKDRNLVKELTRMGYQYTDDINQLDKLTKAPAIGLFAANGMPSALGSEQPLRLAEMTQKALDLLQTKPFFLMLEASQIDWCAHANDIACTMAEMHDMAATMHIIKGFVDAHPNTIFVATADHSTGGLSIGANGEYQWLVNAVKKIKVPAPALAEKLVANKTEWASEWQALTSVPLTPEQSQNMQKAVHAVTAEKAKGDMLRVQTLALAIINNYTYTGWTTSGHTGEDVQVFSYGKDKQKFSGAMDNTDIAKKLFSYLAP